MTRLPHLTTHQAPAPDPCPRTPIIGVPPLPGASAQVSGRRTLLSHQRTLRGGHLPPPPTGQPPEPGPPGRRPRPSQTLSVRSASTPRRSEPYSLQAETPSRRSGSFPLPSKTLTIRRPPNRDDPNLRLVDPPDPCHDCKLCHPNDFHPVPRARTPRRLATLPGPAPPRPTLETRHLVHAATQPSTRPDFR